MRILDRYLIRGFLFPFLYCLVLFSVLFVVIDSFSNFDEYLKHHVPVKIILSYYAYALPGLLVRLVPVAALVAILFILGDLNKHNEINAMKASGVSALGILAPYLSFGIVISFAILLINETVVPQTAITSTAIYDGLILKGKGNLSERAIKNVTLLGKNHRLFYAREFEVLNQTLHDVSVLEDSPERVPQSKLTAKKGRYENGVWVFYDAMKYQLDPGGELVGDPVFSSVLKTDYEEKPEDFIKEASQVEFMNSKQLKEYIKDNKLESELRVRKTERGVVVSIVSDKVLFESGQAAISSRPPRPPRQVAARTRT